MTARGADSFAYDQANRLTSATVSGTTTTYSYDGDGNRASQAVGTATTSYVYDVNRSLPDVLTDGALEYVYGLGLAFAVDGSGNVQVYHTDGLGSVRAITDGTGTVIETYQTDPFGVPTQTQGSSTQPFQFTGEQRDGNGLIYLRARYYDPTTGRFFSRDTFRGLLSFPQTLNRFGYADNNPVVVTDPTGNFSDFGEGGVGGGGGVGPIEPLGPVEFGGGPNSPEEIYSRAVSGDSASESGLQDVQGPPPEVGNQAISQELFDSYANPAEGPGPYEGRRFPVEDPNDRGRTVTDIDDFQGKILWEDKTAGGATDPRGWAEKHIVEKFANYLEARDYLPEYYRHAAIGFRFSQPAYDPEFKAAVEAAVAELRSANPGVTIFLSWGK